MKAATICRATHCRNVQPCADHPPRRPFTNASRSSELYGSARWKRERGAFLKNNPTCSWVMLAPDGVLVPGGAVVAGALVGPLVCGERANTVDHCPRHGGDPDKFWDQATWRALCRRHHNLNTGREVAARRRGGR